MPESFQVAFNFNINQWDNVLGFYVTYFVYFVPVITGCYSIILGTKLLSKEEQKIEARKMELYAGMVENLDYNIGRLISYLKWDTNGFYSAPTRMLAYEP